ncbi:hypothetical protein E2C01_041464 [Portunus trituberculatus]|uniref:Uncharacterized protein n=1 Tax=Portunus trituberculatus TaxID=210409 RepID=A0A5B7FJB7_PORTR|nr:hypothetical protein [Portunus trituberculatus]
MSTEALRILSYACLTPRLPKPSKTRDLTPYGLPLLHDLSRTLRYRFLKAYVLLSTSGSQEQEMTLSFTATQTSHAQYLADYKHTEESTAVVTCPRLH